MRRAIPARASIRPCALPSERPSAWPFRAPPETPSLEALAALGAQPRVVVRPGPLAGAEREADALEDRVGLCRSGRLVEGGVNVLRVPAGKGPALGGDLVGAVLRQQMYRQPRPAAPCPAPRAALRNLHPHLREAPRFVEPELAPAHVRGVVHLEHHVGEVVLSDHHRRESGQDRAFRVQVDGLVRLQDAARPAVLAAEPQVHRPEALDGRAAHRGDPVHERRQGLDRLFVVGGWWARRPRRSRYRRPRTRAALRGARSHRAGGVAGCSRGTRVPAGGERPAARRRPRLPPHRGAVHGLGSSMGTFYHPVPGDSLAGVR